VIGTQRADDHARHARLSHHIAQARLDVREPPVERLFHQHATPEPRRCAHRRQLVAMKARKLRHDDAAHPRRLHPRRARSVRNTEPPNLSLIPQLAQRVDLAQRREVVRPRVQQHDVDVVGAQPPQRLLDALGQRAPREVPRRAPAVEPLACLRADHPALAVRPQQPPDPGLAVAVGRRGVDQVHAELAGDMQQPLELLGGGAHRLAGVVRQARAAERHRAEAHHRDLDAGHAERAAWQRHGPAAMIARPITSPTCGTTELPSIRSR